MSESAFLGREDVQQVGRGDFRDRLVTLVDAEVDDRGGRLPASSPREVVGPAATQPPTRRRTFEREEGDDDVLAVGEVDVGPAERRHLAAAERPVERSPTIRPVDEDLGARRPPPARGRDRLRRRCGQVARMASHSLAVRPRAWPRRVGAGASATSARTKPSRAWRVSGLAGGSSRASRAVRLTAATAMAAVAGARPVWWR